MTSSLDNENIIKIFEIIKLIQNNHLVSLNYIVINKQSYKKKKNLFLIPSIFIKLNIFSFYYLFRLKNVWAMR